MDSGTIIAIIVLVGIIACGIAYYMTNSSSSNSSSYQTTGGKRYMKYKNKYSNRFCTPTTLNLVLALIFAYIVYSNFVKN